MNDILIETNSLLVHSINTLGGAGNNFNNEKNIYDRIDDSINRNFEISASSIKEGDGISTDKRNLFGPLSIILSDGEITYANEIDGGTFVLELGKREKDSDHIPDRINIIKVINERNPKIYNEFCVINYKVIGFILCVDDMRFLIENIISEEMLYDKTKKYNLPYFFLSNGHLTLCEFADQTKNFNFKSDVSFEDIYNHYV